MRWIFFKNCCKHEQSFTLKGPCSLNSTADMCTQRNHWEGMESDLYVICRAALTHRIKGKKVNVPITILCNRDIKNCIVQTCD